MIITLNILQIPLYQAAFFIYSHPKLSLATFMENTLIFSLVNIFVLILLFVWPPDLNTFNI